jgi:hypothetical protein
MGSQKYTFEHFYFILQQQHLAKTISKKIDLVTERAILVCLFSPFLIKNATFGLNQHYIFTRAR